MVLNGGGGLIGFQMPGMYMVKSAHLVGMKQLTRRAISAATEKNMDVSDSSADSKE